MKIDSKDREISSLLTGDYFRIPRFQRPYSWDRANVEEFWEDTVQSQDEADYFIGSIVVYKDKKDSAFWVVDGQQRLTTITMMLCAVRNAFEAQGFKQLAAGVHTLVERPDITNQLQFALQTESSYPYLQEYIQRKGKPELATKSGPEEENLRIAYEYIVQQVQEALESIAKDTTAGPQSKRRQMQRRLESIRDRILDLKLIFVQLDNEDDAYLVFETLNTRGRDLKVADLVKNHITRLKKPANRRVDIARAKWEQVLTTLNESEADLNINAFLLHLWLSRYDFVSEKRLFKSIRKRIDGNSLDDFLDALVNDAHSYRIIHEPAYRTGKWRIEEQGLKTSLEALSLFRVRLSLPLALAVVREWQCGGLKLARVAEILKALEDFHFIFTAVTSQRSSGGISRMFANHGRRLHTAKPIDKWAVCNELKKKLADRVPGKAEFEAKFAEIVYTENRTKQKALVRYILSKFAENDGQPPDMQKMTIEHLASQSDGSIPEATLGQIGNLILVDQATNSERLRNRPFSKKKELLRQRGVKLDASITSASSWGQTEIQTRTKTLAQVAYDCIWKIR